MNGGITRSSNNTKSTLTNTKCTTNVCSTSGIDGGSIKNSQCGYASDSECATDRSITCCTIQCDGSSVVSTKEEVLTNVDIFGDGHTAIGDHDRSIICQIGRILILGELNTTTEFLVTFLDDVTIYFKVTIDLKVFSDCQIPSDRYTTRNSQSTRGRETVTSRCVSCIANRLNTINVECAIQIDSASNVQGVVNDRSTINIQSSINQCITSARSNSEDVDSRTILNSECSSSDVHRHAFGEDRSSSNVECSSNSQVVIDYNLTSSRVKNQITRDGADFTVTINSDLDIICCNISRGDRLVECDCAIYCMSISTSITNSGVAIYIQSSSNCRISRNTYRVS